MLISPALAAAAVWRDAAARPHDLEAHDRALRALMMIDHRFDAQVVAYFAARAAGLDHVWRLDPRRDGHWASVVSAAFEAGVARPAEDPGAAGALIHTLASLDDDRSVAALGRAVDRLAIDDPRVPLVVGAVLASARVSAAPVRARAAWRGFEPAIDHANGFRAALRAGLASDGAEAVRLADRVLATAGPLDCGGELARAFRIAGAHRLDRHLAQVRDYCRRIAALADHPRGAALGPRREIFAQAAIAFVRLAPREAGPMLRAIVVRQCASRALHLDLIAGAVGGLVELAPRHASVVEWTRRVRTGSHP